MRLPLACLFLLVYLPAVSSADDVAKSPPDARDGWKLVWADEFDYTGLPDPAKWGYEVGMVRNREAQHYTKARSENTRVEGGHLVIEARKESYEKAQYTSGSLKSTAGWKYGRIEVRAQLPTGRGMWPAIWMMPSGRTRGWPACGEIDIMEHVGRKPQVTYGTIHGPGYAGAGSLGGWNTQDYDIADDWHTYAIEWDETGIVWFYDGESFFDIGPDDLNGREWVYDQPFFMIVNLALGGTFGGNIALDNEYPMHLFVDHVRVYQRAG